MSKKSQGSIELTGTEKTLIRVFKSLDIPCDLAVWITAVQLKTERQKAEMAVWAWRTKETNQERILQKAMGLSVKQDGYFSYEIGNQRC